MTSTVSIFTILIVLCGVHQSMGLTTVECETLLGNVTSECQSCSTACAPIITQAEGEADCQSLVFDNSTFATTVDEWKTASATDCSIDCAGAWGGWGACTKNCDTGTQTRTYAITTAAFGTGTECPASDGQIQSQTCNTDACGENVDCVGAWSEWTACDKRCGTGAQTRLYTITQAARGTGAACPATDGQTESKECNTAVCGANVDCLGLWSLWSSCTKSCGTGTQTRTYTIAQTATGTGAACPNTDGHTESLNCNVVACGDNIPCVGSWSAWGTCPVKCGGGTHTRTYTITQEATGTGAVCGTATGTVVRQTCNTVACNPTADAETFCTDYGNTCSFGDPKWADSAACNTAYVAARASVRNCFESALATAKTTPPAADTDFCTKAASAACATPEVVTARLWLLGADYARYDIATDAEKIVFKDVIADSISANFNVDKSQVVDIKLGHGSIVVDFGIEYPTAEDAATGLQAINNKISGGTYDAAGIQSAYREATGDTSAVLEVSSEKSRRDLAFEPATGNAPSAPEISRVPALAPFFLIVATAVFFCAAFTL